MNKILGFIVLVILFALIGILIMFVLDNIDILKSVIYGTLVFGAACAVLAFVVGLIKSFI